MESAPSANGGNLLVECLYQHGVRRIFGMPGSHSTWIYDAIQQHGGIETILCRNEQAGAFMADGYARSFGRPGVICTTAGPGATNALTGIAEAYADSIPVLLIAGQVNHDRIHEECGRYHEMDLESIFRPCTRFAGTVMSNEQIPAMTDCAFQSMLTGRPGPAALFLPQDLMAMPANAGPHATPAHLLRPKADGNEIRQAVELLTDARRPAILAAGGALIGAESEITELARRLECPVITTLNGKGIIDERSPYSLGHGRSRRARVALSRADLVIAAGCQFTEVFTASGTIPIPSALIQIDIEPRQIARNYPVKLGIVGDIRNVLTAILAEISAQQDGAWKESWQRARDAKQLKPEWMIETLRQEIPDSSIVFADASELGLRMHTDFPAYAPRTFFYPSNYATLGWGFPAAIGGAIGRTERWTICVCGDGGFMMSARTDNCSSLSLAAGHRHPQRLHLWGHQGDPTEQAFLPLHRYRSQQPRLRSAR